jgi:hypothetical protein
MWIGGLITLFFYLGFKASRVKDAPGAGLAREEQFGRWVQDQSA